MSAHGFPATSITCPEIPPSCAAARGTNATNNMAHANAANAHEYANLFMADSPLPSCPCEGIKPHRAWQMLDPYVLLYVLNVFLNAKAKAFRDACAYYSLS